jgi:hypothetical protein
MVPLYGTIAPHNAFQFPCISLCEDTCFLSLYEIENQRILPNSLINEIAATMEIQSSRNNCYNRLIRIAAVCFPRHLWNLPVLPTLLAMLLVPHRDDATATNPFERAGNMSRIGYQIYLWVNFHRCSGTKRKKLPDQRPSRRTR